MDIKEIAKRIRKTNNSYMLSMSPDIAAEFAEALIESYKSELLKEVGEPTCWMTPDGEGWRMRTKPPEINTKLGWIEFYTSDQVAAAVLKATKPLEEEVERLKGIKNVQLDIYPNDAGTKQQREVDGSLEMGQLLADSKNEETGNPKAERAKSLVWMHTGGGHIADSSGKRIGIFSGDFKHRDRLICAVNSESDLLAQLAKAEQRVAEACSAYMLNKNYNSLEFDRKYSAKEFCAGQKSTVEFLAKMIRSGEWRKFVEEV